MHVLLPRFCALAVCSGVIIFSLQPTLKIQNLDVVPWRDEVLTVVLLAVAQSVSCHLYMSQQLAASRFRCLSGSQCRDPGPHAQTSEEYCDGHLGTFRSPKTGCVANFGTYALSAIATNRKQVARQLDCGAVTTTTLREQASVAELPGSAASHQVVLRFHGFFGSDML